MVIRGSREVPPPAPIAKPSVSPFDWVIAGPGIIEASSDNLAVGAEVAGIVTGLYVEVGQEVKQGDPLFKVDDRDLVALRALRLAELEVARGRVEEAIYDLADKETLYRLASSIADKRAISIEELDRRKHGLSLAQAKLKTAQALVKQSEAQLQIVETDLERAIARSPIDGTILQVNVDLGEFAQSASATDALVLMGQLNPLHVRVDIDEADAWRFSPELPAFAALRGNASIVFPLEFAYLEPYVLPKRDLTGESAERLDTRVLQILYSFDPIGFPVYVGQLVDVWMEGAPIEGIETDEIPEAVSEVLNGPEGEREEPLQGD